MKKLYRSRNDCSLAGVLGGLGEHFEIDPTLIRLAYVIFTIASGFFPGILGYFLAVLVIPKEPLASPMPQAGAATPPAVSG